MDAGRTGIAFYKGAATEGGVVRLVVLRSRREGKAQEECRRWKCKAQAGENAGNQGVIFQTTPLSLVPPRLAVP